MKSTDANLIEFMLNARQFVRLDLYTFTLTSGQTLCYTSGNMALSYGGENFLLGPPISDKGVKSTRGTTVSNVDITVMGDERFTVAGVPFLDFVEGLGLDGASVTIQRAVAASWLDMMSVGPVGVYTRFGGRFSEIKDLGQSQVTITCATWLDLLSTNVPADVYQTSCLNTFGDGRCEVNLGALTVNGQITGVGADDTDPTFLTTFETGLTQADGYFALGALTFTSGGNKGTFRSVKAYANANGTVTLIAPLPAAPAVGDGFSVYPGCALSMSACSSYNNLLRFRGQPFIPPPVLGIPT